MNATILEPRRAVVPKPSAIVWHPHLFPGHTEADLRDLQAVARELHLGAAIAIEMLDRGQADAAVEKLMQLYRDYPMVPELGRMANLIRPCRWEDRALTALRGFVAGLKGN